MASLIDTHKGYLQPIKDPGINTGHALVVAYQKDSTAGDVVDLRLRLLSNDGITLIKEWLITNIAHGFTEQALPLTELEASAITAADYQDRLIYVVQREGTATATQTDNRSLQVSYLGLDVPDTQTTDLRPDAIPASTNLGAAPDFNVLREDPDAGATTWLAAADAAANTSVRMGFDNPTTALTGAQRL